MTPADKYLAEVKALARAATCPACDLEQANAECNCDEQIRTDATQAFTDRVGAGGALRLVAMVEDRDAALGTCRLAIEAALAQYVEFYGKQENGPLYLKLRDALAELDRIAGGSPAKSVVRQNAEADPDYEPYCLRCLETKRMKKIAPLYWRCVSCGAEHDERDGGV